MTSTDRYQLRRTFTASAEDVFRFFVEPDAFSQWFVVPGFRTPVETIDMDARAGGTTKAVMVAEDGSTQIPFTIRYGDVEPPRRVVLYPGHDEEVVVTLSAAPDGTELRYDYRGPATGPDDVKAVEAMLDLIAEHA